MKTAAAALLLAAPAALADLVELTLSGSAATSHNFVDPDTCSLIEFDTEWSMTIVIDTSSAFAANGVELHDAWMIVDGQRRDLDPDAISSFYGNTASLAVWELPTGVEYTHFAGGMTFSAGMDEGTSFWLTADFIRWTQRTSDELARLDRMPVGFTLEDFDQLILDADLGEALAGHNSDLWSRGGEWRLRATSLTVTAVPTPSALLAFGALGLATARRRR